MANITLSRKELINEISEVAGYKTGICLTYSQIIKFVGNDSYGKVLIGNIDNFVRIRPEEYEEIYFRVLRGCGHIPKNARNPSLFILFDLYKKYSFVSEEIIDNIYSLHSNWMIKELERIKISKEKTMEPKVFLVESEKKYGMQGLSIAIDIIDNLIERQQTNPWMNNVRRVDWKDTLELKDLFDSESLTTFYGNFIDQRYIDFLSSNFEDIDNINWRKFEGLTCEFFERHGYKVEIGKGRNDGGIDARIWKSKDDVENPPLIIVQCKRHKEKIDRTIVKALWADLIFEKS